MFMTWTYNTSVRVYEALKQYGDVMGQVGIMRFTVASTGLITGSPNANELECIEAQPNVNWLLTIQNENTATSVVSAILDDATVQRTFLDEIQRLIDTYEWAAGIDIDLENCGDSSRQAGMKSLFERIYAVCQNNGKLLDLCLPPITSANNSVGGEYWCAYEDYKDCCDTAAIMSYGMAWLGSAAGPVSPKWWLDEIYEYALKCFNPEQIVMGVGGWCILWALHQEYSGYSAESGTYYWPVQFMTGKTNMYDFRSGEGRDFNTDRQAYVAQAGYWDNENKICYILPYVYDHINAHMYDASTSPLVFGTYNTKKYATSYTKSNNVAGTATYTMYLTKMLDVDGNEAWPADGFALAVELLQNKPDSLMIWYDAFTEWYSRSELLQQYYLESGSVEFTSQTGYITLNGILTKQYSSAYGPLDLYCRWESKDSGNVGIQWGNYRVTYNCSSRNISIWYNGNIVYSYAYGNAITALSARFREQSIRVYVGTNKAFLFKYDISVEPDSQYPPGLYSDSSTVFTLFRLGDAWTYEPYEACQIDISGSDGSSQSYILGRIERTNVEWNEDNTFTLLEDIEESDTRTTSIGSDYVFRIARRISLAAGVTYTIKYTALDINLWFCNIYIGDADGCGIGYYEDADVLQYWYNTAIHKYGCLGICMWTLGQEDYRIWEQIKQLDAPN